MIIQSDTFPATHASIVICQLTPVLADAPDLRVAIQPSQASGLHLPCQIMADQPRTVRGERIGRPIGHLTPNDNRRLNTAFAFVVGLAGRSKAVWGR